MARGELSASVREVADRLGVSERTVWRWHAAHPLAATADDLINLADEIEERVCASCHTPLPPGVTIRRRFCDPTCRVDAHRAKLARRRFAAASRHQPG